MGLETVLLIGLLGAIACAIGVVRMMRGRTSLSPSAWAGAAVLCFYAVGNLTNRVILPALFGSPLDGVLQHRRPVLSIPDQALVSWVIALLVTLALGAIARWRTGSDKSQPRVDDSPQWVGSDCVVCRMRIVTEPDGTVCADCRAPLHRKCSTRHGCAAESAQRDPGPTAP